MPIADHTTKALVKDFKLIPIFWNSYFYLKSYFLGNIRPGLSPNYPSGLPFNQNFGNTPYYPGAGGCKFISKVLAKLNFIIINN